MKITKSRLAATIFYIIFGSVFVFLGFWQIERGAEKGQIVSNFEELFRIVEHFNNSPTYG